MELTLKERYLYGSSRLGMNTDTVDMIVTHNPNFQQRHLGKKMYELNNHLGNVLAVVTDKKIPIQNGTTGNKSHYVADVVSVTDYYPFGAVMGGRSWSGDHYRWGFNGQEKDDEVKGNGNSINYIARIYDPRLNRFLSVDPLAKSFPMLTPYQFASNTPIWGVDLDGEEVRIYTESPVYYKLNVGHTFITVGDADGVVVYTYGRYAEVDAPSGGYAPHSLNSFSPTGQGVLRKLSKEAAQNYLKEAFSTESVNAYEITDADEQKTVNFFELQFNSPNSITPTTGPYSGDPNSRVVDQYDLQNNNCTTKSCEAVEAGGSKIFRETTQEVMKTQMVKRGGEFDFVLMGTGINNTTPVQAPWTPAGLQQMLDYQNQNEANPVNNVTIDVKH